MLIWDLIILALLLVFALRGWRRGLIQSILALAGGLAALLAALVGAGALDDMMAERVVMPLFGGKLSQYALRHAGLTDSALWESVASQAESGYRALSDLLGERLSHIGVSSPAALAALEDPMAAIGNRLALQLARSLCFVLLFVLLFIAALGALWLIARALSILHYVPVLGVLNRLGGATLGLLTAVLLSWLLLKSAQHIEPQLVQSGGSLSTESVQDSYLVKYIIRPDLTPAEQ